MKRPDGVSWYLTATMNVYFPEGDVCCQNCPMFTDRRGQEKGRCFMTNRLIFVPNAEGLPDGCPLTVTGEVVGNKKEKGE